MYLRGKLRGLWRWGRPLNGRLKLQEELRVLDILHGQCCAVNLLSRLTE